MMTKQITTILPIPLMAVALPAQTSKKQALLMAMGANGKQMVFYQWKQKITVVRKETPATAILEEIRFDATGQLQRVTLAKPEEKKMGPLRQGRQRTSGIRFRR
jgi:hypothetical protein